MNIRRSTDRIGSIGFGVEFGRYLLDLMLGDFDEAEECSHAAPHPCEVEQLLEVGIEIAAAAVPVRWMSFGLMFALACAAGVRRTASASATAPVG